MGEGNRRSGGVTAAAGWLTLFFAAAALLHALLPTYFDSDTAYHLAVARLTAAQGTLHEFPWTPFSWLAGHYADKEFLFHVLLVPVAGLEPSTASRLAGTLLGGVLLSVLYLIMRREGVERAGLWTLAALTASSAFLARFAMVRPHLLSISLSLLVVWSAARRRWLILGASALLFPLCYAAWHLPAVLALLVAFAELLARRRPDWRPFLLTIAALSGGVVIHPNFPVSLRLFWIQNVKVLVETAWQGGGGFDLGGEFRPFSPRGLALHVLLPASLGLSALWRSWEARGRDVLPLAFALVSLAFLLLTLKTQRFVEYLVPFSVLAAALTWTSPRLRPMAAAVLAAGALIMALFGRPTLAAMRERTDLIPREVRESLAAVVEPGAQVVTCDWQFTGDLMLALPGRRFVVALDPVFFAVEDPELYRLWYETVRRPPPRPSSLLREAFGARYAVCTIDRKWWPFLRALEEDPGAGLAGAPGWWRVYRLVPADMPSSRRTEPPGTPVPPPATGGFTQAR